MLTDRYLGGIPSDSRAAQGKSLGPHLINDANMARIRGLHEIAQRRGQTLAQLAIAWVLRDPRVTSVLLGASTVAQLEQNVGALQQLDFSAAELAEIDTHAVDGDLNLWAGPSTA